MRKLAPVDLPAPTLVARSVVLTPTGVEILDRRRYPFERTWVTCATVTEVAAAIRAMVTQSSGPYFAAAAAMVLAARAGRDLPDRVDQVAGLRRAAAELIAARPTNDGVRVATAMMLGRAEEVPSGGDLVSLMEEEMAATHDRYLARSRALGSAAAELLDDGDTILVHCWPESYLTETVAAAWRAGKTLRAICTETRPYLQGARLTAESLAEMGVETRVITDGMAAHVMSRGMVSKFVTAADRVTMDGHVVNKVGTLQIAIAARELGVPYLALVHRPDPEALDASSVPLEDRDGDEVLQCLGVPTASSLVSGLYPAFDITPPRCVHAIVTDRGPFAPADVARYYDTADVSA